MSTLFPRTPPGSLALHINSPWPGRLACWCPWPGAGRGRRPLHGAGSRGPAAHLALGSEAAIVFLPSDAVGRFRASLLVPLPLPLTLLSQGSCAKETHRDHWLLSPQVVTQVGDVVSGSRVC